MRTSACGQAALSCLSFTSRQSRRHIQTSAAERNLSNTPQALLPASASAPVPSPSSSPSSKSTTKSKTQPTQPSPLPNGLERPNPQDTTFTPKSLSRPIGLSTPPRPGENIGVDTRSWRQRRDDFFDWDTHLKRRRELTRAVATPYFREWSNMRFSNGKSFLSPPSLFRASRALYFPNLQGQTLHPGSKKKPRDTSTVLEGRISVVSVYSGTWAEHQTLTFTAEGQNPGLQAAVSRSGGTAQMLDLNVEENVLKAWLVRRFMGSLRRRKGRENWDRYFLIRRGITDEMREMLGLLNSRVGYVYLLDARCRIRWAGSGRAEGGEREGLVRGVGRLLEERRLEVQGLTPITKGDEAKSEAFDGDERRESAISNSVAARAA